ncbi:MAG: radical SAM protein [Chloroflexi bacterium]|nr:radical SAM protein [Chloroflexota bacterium]
MEDLQKLQRLSQAGELDVEAAGCRHAKEKSTEGIVLTHAQLPNGRTTTLLKSLLTSVCENNCYYCPFRSDRDFRQESFSPDDFANLVVNLTKAGLIQGVFLSSGIAGGGITTEDRLIKTAEILRFKRNYQGYLHLKIMPGAEYEQVLQAMRLADRVSINLEAANAVRLPRLAPQKDFEKHLLRPLRWIESIRRSLPPMNTWKNRWPSSCTQFVVGGAGESDLELLETTQDLHQNYGLLRAYFSAFRPHRDTPLENWPAATYRRELRLYQADYLIRDYGFTYDELNYTISGNLISESDPKKVWAEQNLRHNPMEINSSSKEDLLRIPGIGLKNAEKIVINRRINKIRDISGLEKLGINTQRMREFILLDGRRPLQQLSLF